jgi:hypothetical protein
MPAAQSISITESDIREFLRRAALPHPLQDIPQYIPGHSDIPESTEHPYLSHAFASPSTNSPRPFAL